MSSRSILFFIGAVVLVFIIFLRDPLIKVALVVAARQMAGVEVTIDDLALSLTRQSAHIRGFKAYDPPGFPRAVMIDVPELMVDLDVGALFKGVIHLKYVRLRMKELSVVKNEEGETNINALRFASPVQPSAEENKSSSAGNGGQVNQPGPAKAVGKKPAEPVIRMDLVSLNLGRVVIREMRADKEPRVRVIELNVQDKEFKNIRSASELAALVMTEALVTTPLKHGFMKIKGLSASLVGGILEGVLK
ncbi:MAG: hypothetical protein WCO69_04350 [Candidatus Omnitrophota bacterium]